jgi:hypothetical protein
MTVYRALRQAKCRALRAGSDSRYVVACGRLKGDWYLLLRLAALDLILSTLALSAVLQLIANDRATRTQAVLGWAAIGALPILLVALIGLLVGAMRRSAGPS